MISHQKTTTSFFQKETAARVTRSSGLGSSGSKALTQQEPSGHNKENTAKEIGSKMGTSTSVISAHVHPTRRTTRQGTKRAVYKQNTDKNTQQPQRKTRTTVKSVDKEQVDADDSSNDDPGSNTGHDTDSALPNPNDPTFYCCICKINEKSKSQFHGHLKTVHNIKPGPKRRCLKLRRPSNKIIPDEDDPNFYCKSCKRTLASRARYFTHLREIHEMDPQLPPMFPAPARPIRYGYGANDPSTSHCVSCKTRFADPTSHRAHNLNKHKGGILPDEEEDEPEAQSFNINPDIEPDIEEPNNYCKSCDATLKDKASYRAHLLEWHNINCPSRRSPPPCKPDPNIKPDPYNEKNHCVSCNRTYHTKPIYRIHLKMVHNITISKIHMCLECQDTFGTKDALNKHSKEKHGKKKAAPNQGKRIFTPNPDITPDADDPNHYCQSCSFQFANTHSYRNHLRNFHDFKLERLTSKPITNSDMLPLVDDPENTHCRVCNYTYTGRKYYRKHCRKFHGMQIGPIRVKPIPDLSIIPDPEDPEHYCKSCKIKYGRRSAYRTHLGMYHDILLKPIMRPYVLNPDIEPDPEDPNHHCKSCDVTYCDRNNYRNHLLSIHDICVQTPVKQKYYEQKESIRKDDVTPDIDDPNNYCAACCIKYVHRSSYTRHLQSVHQLKPDYNGTIVLPKELIPDIHDANYFCRVCDKSLHKRLTYYIHLKFVHKLETPPMSKPLPKRYPDPHCQYCDMTYSSSTYHRAHMKRFHDEIVAPLLDEDGEPIPNPNKRARLAELKEETP